MRVAATMYSEGPVGVGWVCSGPSAEAVFLGDPGPHAQHSDRAPSVVVRLFDTCSGDTSGELAGVANDDECIRQHVASLLPYAGPREGGAVVALEVRFDGDPEGASATAEAVGGGVFACRFFMSRTERERINEHDRPPPIFYVFRDVPAWASRTAALICKPRGLTPAEIARLG